MKVYEVSSELRDIALKQAERGMGYQEITATFGPFAGQRGLLLAGHYFHPQEFVKFAAVQAAEEGRLIFLEPTPPEIVPFPASPLIKQASIVIHSTIHQIVGATPPPKPPFPATTRPGETFYRLTAFKDDWRITPQKGLVAETYTTSDNDIKLVPSGLAAVGRYALPSPLPAIHMFMIKPNAGTEVAYGTVRPYYGMAGGGVEAYFPKGTNPGSVFYAKELPVK